MTPRRQTGALLAAILVVGGCVSGPTPSSPAVLASPERSESAAPSLPSLTARASSTPSGSVAPSPTGPIDACDATLGARAVEAVESVEGYRYTAEGSTWQQRFDADPLATPTTELVEVAFEGAYQAPDRSSLRYIRGGTPFEPDETRQIGRDLWILAGDRWESLPDAADPERANVLADVLRDASPEWELVATYGPKSTCILASTVPLQDRARRTLTIDLASWVAARDLRPAGIQVQVVDAFDPSGARHDSDLTYRVDYAEVVIEPPG